MGFVVEPLGDEEIMLTITSIEGFTATSSPDGKITIIGPKDAFFGLGELLVDEMGGDQ